jgi:peptidoglycan/xylan/chitin deacetylase (PgdA/CDA1 family)
LQLSKCIARKIVFPLIVATKAEKLFSFNTYHNKLIIVYHGVASNPNHDISVGPIDVRQFEKHLKYFKENFDVIPQNDIIQMYRDGFIPKRKTIAITFDDGYYNNYSLAFPLLQKFSFPSTMYIITQCFDDEYNLTWYDYVDIIKNSLKIEQVDTSILKRQRVNNLESLRGLIKTLNIQERALLFQEISRQVDIVKYKANTPTELWKLMNRQQVKELANSGLVEIGSHTHNHPNLGNIPLADVKYEVTHSRSLLMDVTQKDITSIAFPDGSYTDDVKKICLNAGYKNLLAVDYKCNSDKSDKNVLPRYCISSTTTFESNIIAIQRSFKPYGF